MAVAFFDLDLTVLDVNSVSLWVRAERKGGRLTRKDLMRALWALFRYRLGYVDLEPLIREAVSAQRGQAQQAFESRVQAFFNREIESRIRPGAIEALEHHRALGDHTVILTTSSQALANACASAFGFSDAIGSRFKVDEKNCFTGLPYEPLCFGAGKVHWARQWCQTHGERIDDSTFYTDSFSDLAMLEVVGSPVVVNGDRRLMGVAARRKWTRVDWGQTQ